MKGRSESSYTHDFCQALKRVNAYVLTFVGGDTMQQAGLPDRYVCHRKFRGWLEMKKQDNTCSPDQILVMRSLLERGDVCFVVRFDCDFVSVECPPLCINNVQQRYGAELIRIDTRLITGREERLVLLGRAYIDMLVKAYDKWIGVQRG